MKAERLEEIHFELEEFDMTGWENWRPLKGEYSSKEDAEWMMRYLRLIKGKTLLRAREVRRRAA